MFQLPFCYRDVLEVIILSLIAFPCIPMVKFLASNSDRNDPIKIAASATIHGSVFFCGNACDWSARSCVAGLQLRAIHSQSGREKHGRRSWFVTCAFYVRVLQIFGRFST